MRGGLAFDCFITADQGAQAGEKLGDDTAGPAKEVPRFIIATWVVGAEVAADQVAQTEGLLRGG